MFDEKNNDRNDALGRCIQDIADVMLPPAALEEAVKAGVPYRKYNEMRAGVHVRKFSKAVLAYAACLVVLLGTIFVLPRLFESDTPAKSDPVTTPNVSDPLNHIIDTENSKSDFEYSVNWEGGVSIRKYIGTDPTVVIPKMIDNKPVTQIKDKAFVNSDIISVKMPDSITSIDSQAFFVCVNLTTVELSSNVETIGSQAFYGCIKLSNITLPGSLQKLNKSAFQMCTALTHIYIPKSVTEWGRNVFSNSGLETVELEEGLEAIGESAFSSTNLKEVIIPGSVKRIDYRAFYDCKKLEKITLNEGLVSIDIFAFNATKIEEIVIPRTVESCSELAFVRCDALQKVKFEGNAPADFDNQDPGYEASYGQYLPGYTICYHEGATGFTSPEWCGYPTEIW